MDTELEHRGRPGHMECHFGSYSRRSGGKGCRCKQNGVQDFSSVTKPPYITGLPQELQVAGRMSP